jgi:hypothetical protein
MAPEMNSFWQECAGVLLPALVAALGALATYAVALLRSWVKAKTAAIEDKNTREGIDHAMARLDYITATIVADLNQRAKQYAADGRITPEDAVKLKTFAITRVKQVMPDYMRATLQDAVGGLDKYISSKIEQKVLEQKPMEKRPCA